MYKVSNYIIIIIYNIYVKMSDKIVSDKLCNRKNV